MNTEKSAFYDNDGRHLFHLAYDGRWFHDGAEIRRAALARLFSDRALKLDDKGRYWLRTPFEKYPVEVEDVPFIIVDYDIRGDVITLTTNMGDGVVMGPDHPLELRPEPLAGAIVPYIMVRDGLMARLDRAVYYAFVDLAVERDGHLIIRSGGVDHVLGAV